MRTVVGLVLCCVAFGACSQAGDRPAAEPPAHGGTASTAPDRESVILFEDDFESDPFARWEPVTKAAWAWEKTGRSGVFELVKNVPLTESVRAPFNRNLAKGVTVGDFQFDADLQSTTRDYPNQSLCLFFGYQDPSHMYYVHFGRQTSDTSNQVFIVNGKDRTPISTKTPPGTAWDDAWHHARIVRTVEDGAIRVYFDDMENPVMTAADTTFGRGQIGIGSFDDTGRFDNVVVSRVQQP